MCPNGLASAPLAGDTLFTGHVIRTVPVMCRVPKRHFVLKANKFPLSCLRQSRIGLKAKTRWLWCFRNSKELKPFMVIKELALLLFFSCGTSLSRGGMSESKLLERVLRRTWLWCGLFSYRLVPTGVERKSPVPVLWMASIPPHACLPRVLSLSRHLKGGVQR